MAPPSPTPPAPPASRARRLLTTLASVAVSLVIAEGGASLVHHRAFPYLNIYEPDPALGVRLLPNAETRVRTRSGHVTDIRTNALGFRGADWTTTDERTRVMLLGDSQVFGYNVPEADAFAARLEKHDLAVLNAAVPTYGPPDYVIALQKLAPTYHPRFVLFVANAANDWFEPVPNQARTTSRDGWVTGLGAPESRWFPFRGWVMGRSHLVFGVRQVASFVGDPQMPPTQSASRLKNDLKMLRRGALRPNKLGQLVRSTLTPQLRAARDACAGLGCEVIAVALPSDVQVSADEWAKYRAKPIDLTDTEALLEDFIADAKDLGVRAVSLLAPLRAAEPGAFLDDDYHMSAKGHQAVTDALLPLLRLDHEALLEPEQP